MLFPHYHQLSWACQELPFIKLGPHVLNLETVHLQFFQGQSRLDVSPPAREREPRSPVIGWAGRRALAEVWERTRCANRPHSAASGLSDCFKGAAQLNVAKSSTGQVVLGEEKWEAGENRLPCVGVWGGGLKWT